MLEVWPVTSPHAAALITVRDAARALEEEGVRAVLMAEDVPGLNDIGAIRKDEPLLADTNVFFHGQIVAVVVGESLEACRRGAELVEIEYQVMPAVLTIEEAVAVSSYHTELRVIESGDCEEALASAPLTLEGEVTCGGQDHFCLETQVAWAEPLEDGALRLHVSSESPSQVQAIVAGILGTARNRIFVESHRLGGAFGGKETQANAVAAIAALASRKTGAPVRARLNRRQDMALTGKRHPFHGEFKAGFDEAGRIQAARISLYANGGWALDLSGVVMERALLHLDSAYHIPNVRFSGRVCKTNLASNTAFRGSGAAEAMLVIEEVLGRVARRLGLPGEKVRLANLYGGETTDCGVTPYGQRIGDNRIKRVVGELMATAECARRRSEIADWNESHPQVKRGLALTPVKMGVGSTMAGRNEAAALVHLLADGSAVVNHGGTESGQGIHTKMGLIAAEALGVDMGLIRVNDPSTEIFPDAALSVTSNSSELNGRAVRAACKTIIDRMRPLAAQLLHGKGAPAGDPAELVISGGSICYPRSAEVKVAIRELITRCRENGISLSATGFFRTPGLFYDHDKGRGNPFGYFAVGAALSEVEVDGFTGEYRCLRTDILQDAGRSMHPGIDRCRIEGGFMQGLGWLTCEEVLWDSDGVLWSDSPSRYKIPTMGDVPLDFRVALWDGGGGGSAEGEFREVEEAGVPLALSVREAINDAVAAFGPGPAEAPFRLDAPATPESVYQVIEARFGKKRAGDGGRDEESGGRLPADGKESAAQETSNGLSTESTPSAGSVRSAGDEKTDLNRSTG